MKRNLMMFFLSAWINVLFCSSVSAQSWPHRPVRAVVPFAAGGSIDILTRTIAARLTSVLGQPFIVENRVGAGGAIAAEFVAGAAPDGYTYLVGSAPPILIVPLLQSVKYDGLKDFVPVVDIARNRFVLGIHPSIPAKTLDEFVEYAKARPGALNYGSAGTGSVTHLSGALLLARAGLILTHVPYKGAAPAVADLVAGQLQMVFGTFNDVYPYMRAGKVKVLGVSSDKRIPELLDVPSIAESYPGFNMDAWNGLGAPAGTPREVVVRLANEVSRYIKEPAATEAIRKMGFAPSGIMLEEFGEFIRNEKTLWIQAVKVAGIKQE
jgi:tripartite-type tricarboxylate transporter receptor subunit TctC